MRWTGCASRGACEGVGSMRSVSTGMRLARRLAGALGAVAAAGVVVGATGPSPAGDGASTAVQVCLNPQQGCSASNHNQVLL
jgi:hypothetical protein